MQALREYQIRAIAGVHTAWNQGSRAVLLVAPTGSGKTRMGEELVYSEMAAGGCVLWIAHRRELIRQAADRLRSRFGHLDVGLIAPGEGLYLDSPIQVATVQTLLARDRRPEASLTVFDEAHHYIADDWKALAEAYPRARILGLTATPERQDGKPLGDVYSGLVVAESYSNLIKDGHLVPCRVYQPPDAMAGNELAQDPLVAWQRYAEGSSTFAFCSTVDGAYELAARFRAANVRAATIEAKTPKAERDEILEDFASGRTTVLTNVYALTEGVDVPSARCVLLARSVGHVGPFLQMAGRVLRPAPGKTDAILIDLTGASLVHGLPTEDREYSLDGDGIRRTSPAPLRNCAKCGATLPAWQRRCPECGYEAPEQETPQPRIYDLELRAVFAGADTPSTAKQREYNRLRQLGKERGWALYFVQKEYKKLFGELPIISDATELEMRTELGRLTKIQQERGFKPGFVSFRFKQTFGKWPSRNLRPVAPTNPPDEDLPF
jgi:DNA repair protein RadD